MSEASHVLMEDVARRLSKCEARQARHARWLKAAYAGVTVIAVIAWAPLVVDVMRVPVIVSERVAITDPSEVRMVLSADEGMRGITIRDKDGIERCTFGLAESGGLLELRDANDMVVYSVAEVSGAARICSVHDASRGSAPPSQRPPATAPSSGSRRLLTVAGPAKITTPGGALVTLKRGEVATVPAGSTVADWDDEAGERSPSTDPPANGDRAASNIPVAPAVVPFARDEAAGGV